MILKIWQVDCSRNNYPKGGTKRTALFGIMGNGILSSIGTATLTLSGYETGKKSVKGVWDVVLSSAFLAWGICALFLVLFILFPGQILGLFTADKEVLAAAGLYLLIVGLDLFPKSGNITFGAGIKGYGEPSWMLKTQLIGTVFVIVASTIMVMKLHMGIMEIFILVVVDESFRFILNSAKLRSIKRSSEAKKMFCEASESLR